MLDARLKRRQRNADAVDFARKQGGGAWLTA